MKLKHLLPIAALAFPALLSARPTDPADIVRMQNPDGSFVEVRSFGDERFSFFTLADGETIVEKGADGFWKASVREGRQLKAFRAEDLKVLRSETRPFNYEPIEKPATRMAPITRDEGRTTFPTLAQDVHSLVVLIEYADTPFSVPNPKEAFDKMLNSEGYSDYGSCGSARDYYIKTSNGKFRPIFDVTDVVKLSQTSAYYVANGAPVDGAGRNGRFGVAIQEALTYLDEQGMDFSKYDYDGDGDIDTIFFFYSGYGQADSHNPNTIWPHQADFNRYVLDYEGSLRLDPIILDGKRFGPYACSNELNAKIPEGAQQPYLDGIGAFVHEFGHVLGLPDLYDTIGTSTTTPGEFSVMANGSYNDYSTCPPLFSAYEQWVCHWLEFDDLNGEGKEVTVNSLSQTGTASRILVRQPTPREYYYPGEFFVLETRSNDSWDRTVPEKGLLIWHINFDHDTWVNNQVNVNKKPRVEVLQSNTSGLRTYAWGVSDGTSFIEPSMRTALIPESPVFTSGKYKYGNYLSDIKYDEASQSTSLRFNLDKEIPSMTTSMRTPTRAENDEMQFTLSWDPVEGADGYYLTCYATTAAGQTSYLENLNDTYVGNVTHYTLTSFFRTYWNSEVHAFVRVKSKYPSTEKSQEITFVPSTLQPAGINDIIDADAPVYGLQGEIVAPEGAEIFNLSGIRTGRTGLPAGIYLVRYAGKTVKVVVR